MATLMKCKVGPGSDRESWLRLAIQFMKRGLWLSDGITIHGPHDDTNCMWGDAQAFVDDGGSPLFDGRNFVNCVFRATANGSKYRPFRILIWDEDDRAVRYTTRTDLSSNARRWMRYAKHALKTMGNERVADQQELQKAIRLCVSTNVAVATPAGASAASPPS
jgi:hypothetical protein